MTVERVEGGELIEGRSPGALLRGHWPVLVSVIIALATFAWAVSFYPRVPIVSDAFNYSRSGWALALHGFLGYGGVHPDAFVTPGYPVFLAVFYLFTRGASSFTQAAMAIQPTVLAAQLILAVGTVGLLAECGVELGGTLLGLTAGMLGAIYLPFAWASSVALSETLGTFLMSLLLLGLRLVAEKRPPGYLTFAAFGLVTAAVGLTRPVYVAWAVAPVFWILVRRRVPVARIVRGCGFAALGFALLMVPWWARNVVTLHEVVLLSTGSGQARLDGVGGYPLSAQEQTLFNTVTAAEGDGASAVANQRLAAEWGSSPAQFLKTRARTAIGAVVNAFVGPEVYYYLEGAHAIPEEYRVDVGPRITVTPAQLRDAEVWTQSYQRLLVVLAALSLLFVWRWPQLLLAVTVPVYSVLVHSTLLFIVRYFFPAMPAVILMAAAAICGAVLAVRLVFSGPPATVGPVRDSRVRGGDSEQTRHGREAE